MNTKSLVVAFSMLAAGVVFAGSYVEYIDTSRSKKQVIDSGYVVKPSTKIVADFAFLDVTKQVRLFGLIGSTGSVACQMYINGSGFYAYTCTNNYNAGWWQMSPATAATVGDRVTFALSAPDRMARLYRGDTRLATHSHGKAISNTAQYRLGLFGNKFANATYTDSGYECYSSVRLWSFRIFEGNALVKDLRPYKDDAGKYCLKDRVGGGLLYPANGSELAGGDEIDLEAMEAAQAARTVLLAPGFNVTTNVSAFGGDVDVVVNEGLGTGGIVNMDGFNWYSGTTTLNGGTLVADNVTAGAGSSLGSSKTLYMDAGTFKYNGGTGTFNGAVVTKHGPFDDTKSAIFDVTGDLTLAGAFTNAIGGFVKTGPGVLRIPGGEGTTTTISAVGGNGNLNAVTWNANGDSTVHGSAFEVIEGTLVLGEAGGTFNIHGNAADAWVGKVNVDPRTTPGVQEKSGILEVRGGTVNVNNFLMVGVKNGFEGSTPEGKPQSGIRVYGGTFNAKASVSLGRNKTSGVYRDSGNNLLRLNTAPFLEVHGGLMRLYNSNRVGLCDDAGADSRVFIDGGRLFVCNADNTTGGAMAVGAMGDGDPTWPSLADVTVCTNGQLDVTGFYIANNARENVTANVKVFDGGVFRFNYFNKNSTKASNALTLLFDGGIAEIRYAGNANWIKGDVTAAEIGTRGMAIRVGTDADVADAILTVGKTLTAADTHPGEEPQGVSFHPNPNRTAAANGAGVRFTVPQAWAGPTRIGDTAVFELADTGAFPAASAVTLEPGGSLALVGASQTFSSLTLGAAEKAGAVKLRLLKGCSIAANAFALMPGASVAFDLFETVTVNSITAATGDPLTTAGTYTLLSAPASAADDLQALARSATVANAADGVRYAFGVETSGGTASLTVTVGDAAAVTDIAAAAGETETVDAAITGDYLLRTNPSASGAGTVDLGGYLSGFGGGLASGGGTTKIADLSFVASAFDWVIGPGTLWYTGAATTVPGLTINSGAAHCGELKLDSAVTLLSAATVEGAMCKSGAGDLILKGNGLFDLANANVSYSSGSAGNVPAANGDGRTSAFDGFMVSEGRVVVGTLNDPDDAPMVRMPFALTVGPRTSQTAGQWETTGEFILNNGTVEALRTVIGYYNGMPETIRPGETIRPKLTVNGGTFTTTQLYLNQDAGGAQTSSPEFELNGGTFNFGKTVHLSHQPASSDMPAPCKITINGGLFTGDGPIICGNATGAVGPGVFILNGGTVECGEGQNFLVGNSATGGRQELYLNGGLLACLNLAHNGAAGSTGVGSGAVYFRGGVLKLGRGRPVNTSYDLGSSTAAKQMEFYVGAAGAKFDFTDWFAGGEDAALVTVRNKFLKDPDCTGEDGGLWFYGKGTAILRPETSGSTFTGPVRASGGFMIGLDNGYTDSRTKTFIIEEGSGFRLSSDVAFVNHVTLGTAGGTEPVLLDFCADRSTTGIIVSNDVSILSPVTVSFHRPGGSCNTIGSQPGTYGVLYYPASLESQIDLGKFVANPKLPEVTMTFTKADSDYAGNAAGMRMVKVTIEAAASTAGTTWTGSANDGKWTTGGNWNGGEAPNGRDAMAVFPAAGAGTSVSVDTGVKVGRIALYGGSGAGYTFTGSPNFEHTDFKTAPGIVAESGTHTFAGGLVTEDTQARSNESTANGGRSGAIEVKAKTGSCVVIDGPVKMAATRDLYINNPTSGGGTTVLNGDVDANNVRVQSGTLEMGDMSHLDGKTLTVGPGTFHYTGPAAVTSAKIVTDPGAGVQGKAIASILRIDDELTLTEKFDAQSDSLMKAGPGTLVFASAGAVTNRIGYGGANTSWNMTGADWYWPSNGDSLTKQGIGSLCIDEGEVVLAGGSDTVFHLGNNGGGVDIFVGAQSRGWNYATHKAALTVYSGTVKAPWVYLGHTFNHGKDGSGHLIPTYAEYNQHGGSVSFATLCFCYDLSDFDTAAQATVNLYGGTLNVSGVMRFGQTYNKTGVNPPHATFNLYGGTYNHTDTSGTQGTRMGYLGSKANGQNTLNRACDATLNIHGGEYNEIERIHMGCNASTSRLSLHGGVLKAENILLDTRTSGDYCFFAGGSAYLYWNGGTYAPVGTTAANQTLEGLTEVLVSTNGAVVTTASLAGESYTVAQPLLHDPALAGVDGGFTKTGAKPLALAGANAYNGDTYVAEGQLVIPAGAAATALPPDSAVVVAPGAELVMAEGTEAAVGALAADMAKTYGTITGLVPARGGRLYLANVSGALMGLELPITLSGGAHLGRFRSWEIYVDGVKADGFVLNVKNNKIVVGTPLGTRVVIR